ncbi:hypothetical protein KM043_008141 [Ampulex compressa]|nr:hypothetical protein KM043_008141 [Ampulex compressa]
MVAAKVTAGPRADHPFLRGDRQWRSALPASRRRAPANRGAKHGALSPLTLLPECGEKVRIGGNTLAGSTKRSSGEKWPREWPTKALRSVVGRTRNAGDTKKRGVRWKGRMMEARTQSPVSLAENSPHEELTSTFDGEPGRNVAARCTTGRLPRLYRERSLDRLTTKLRLSAALEERWAPEEFIRPRV